jgi:hypothetical protein
MSNFFSKPFRNIVGSKTSQAVTKVVDSVIPAKYKDMFEKLAVMYATGGIGGGTNLLEQALPGLNSAQLSGLKGAITGGMNGGGIQGALTGGALGYYAPKINAWGADTFGKFGPAAIGGIESYLTGGNPLQGALLGGIQGYGNNQNNQTQQYGTLNKIYHPFENNTGYKAARSYSIGQPLMSFPNSASTGNPNNYFTQINPANQQPYTMAVPGYGGDKWPSVGGTNQGIPTQTISGPTYGPPNPVSQTISPIAPIAKPKTEWGDVLKNAALGYMGNGTQGALAGAAGSYLNQSHVLEGNANAAAQGGLNAIMFGGNPLTGAAAGVAGNEWTKATTGNGQLENLPAWAKGAGSEGIHAIGAGVDPITGLALGGIEGAIIGNGKTPSWLPTLNNLIYGAVASNKAAKSETGQAAAAASAATSAYQAASAASNQSQAAQASTLLSQLLGQANEASQKQMDVATRQIADQMQQRGIRTSGIHMQALSDAATIINKQLADANIQAALQVNQVMMQQLNAQLDRDFEYQMMMAKIQAAEAEGKTQRKQELLGGLGQYIGQILAQMATRQKSQTISTSPFDVHQSTMQSFNIG